MLAQLNAANRGHAFRVVPLLAAAEQLPLRAASLDVVTAFNCVHHFDLGRFLTAAARVLKPGGQLFIYTRTPQQNARTIWGQYFPGFTEHEQRLHTQAALRDAVSRTGGLTMITAQTFGHPRTSTAGRLQAQAEGRHYSTFSLYTPEELRTSITAFLTRLPSAEVRWVDEHLLIAAAQATTTRRNLTARAARQARRSGSGPPDQRRARRPGPQEASWRPASWTPPRPDHPVADLSQKKLGAGPSSAASSTNTSEPPERPGQQLWPSSGTPQAKKITDIDLHADIEIQRHDDHVTVRIPLAGEVSQQWHRRYQAPSGGPGLSRGEHPAARTPVPGHSHATHTRSARRSEARRR